jgi:hypothetical protein
MRQAPNRREEPTAVSDSRGVGRSSRRSLLEAGLGVSRDLSMCAVFGKSARLLSYCKSSLHSAITQVHTIGKRKGKTNQFGWLQATATVVQRVYM